MTQPAEPGSREKIRADYERACARFRELLGSMKGFGERLTVEGALRHEPEHIAQVQRLLGHA